MKLRRVGYVKPKCECGTCDIRITEATNGDSEVVPSNEYSTRMFHEIDVMCLGDDCEVIAVDGNSDGFAWVG